MESFGSRENMELAEWLEAVLKQYCQALAERQTKPDEEKPSKMKMSKVKAKKKLNNNVVFQLESDCDSGSKYSSASDDEGIKLGESANPDENKDQGTTATIFLLITGIKFEKIRRDLGNDSQDDILRVDIDYFVGDTTVCRNEHFLINVSRRFENKDDPSVEKLLETGRREIDVYTKLFPKLEALIDFNLVNVKLGFPTCFFGEYETECPEERGTSAKKELAEAFGFDPSSTKSSEDLNRTETRSIFILHDLEKMNFIQKKPAERLTLAETKAVLREIAQIHAASWVVQIKSLKTSLFDDFPFLLHPRRAVPVCVTLCEQGMEPFTKSMAARLRRDLDGPDLVRRIKSYSSKLVDTFFKLMQPPEQPSPSCLIHLDLQLGNIQFRYNQLPTESTDTPSTEPPIFIPKHENEIECRISNWKIASIGSPLHDVAFLLLSSVSPEIRREHKTEFIQYYYHVFEDTAKKLKVPLPFELSDLMKEYNRSTLFALLLVIGNIEEEEDAVLDKASLDSFIEALRDLVKSGTI